MGYRIKKSDPAYRHAEAILYQYPYVAAEIEEIRESILLSSQQEQQVYAKASGQSDPTAMKAALLVTHKRLKVLEQQQAAVDKVYSHLPPEKQLLIRLKYWGKGYITDIGIAACIPVADRTVRRWKREIIGAIACEMGWVKMS